jgi:ketosteroid isomerase-like protein
MKVLLILLGCMLVTSTVPKATAQDVAAPIHQFLDALNRGDGKAAKASYARGDILIVDEVAPHRWYGANAHDEWMADLIKHDKANEVNGGGVKYEEPTRSDIEGDAAYVIVPTVYLYRERGKPMVEEAQMTFVLKLEGDAWKISGWIWSGVKPHPAQ